MHTPITSPIATADAERFYSVLGLNPNPDACHLWPGGKSGGRGRFWLQGETRYAHQVAWLLERGEIPVGQELIRNCAMPTCCNVRHYTLGVPRQTTDENLLERFMAKVSIQPEPKPGMASPCWLWTGALGTGGYAVMNCFGKQRKGSHVAYYLTHHSWPPAGLGQLHDCDDPRCVNIEHLHLGTNAQNCRERDERGRTARGQRHGSRTKPESVPRGERNGRSSLTLKQVVLIRRTCDAHQEFHGLYACLGRLVGVGEDVVGQVATRVNWLSVPEDAAPDIQALPLAELEKLKKAWPSGEASASAKVTDRQVREIRCLAKRHAKVWGVQRLLAARYEISESHIHRLINRELRGDLEDRFEELGDLPPLERRRSSPA